MGYQRISEIAAENTTAGKFIPANTPTDIVLQTGSDQRFTTPILKFTIWAVRSLTDNEVYFDGQSVEMRNRQTTMCSIDSYSDLKESISGITTTSGANKVMRLLATTDMWITNIEIVDDLYPQIELNATITPSKGVVQNPEPGGMEEWTAHNPTGSVSYESDTGKFTVRFQFNPNAHLEVWLTNVEGGVAGYVNYRSFYDLVASGIAAEASVALVMDTGTLAIAAAGAFMFFKIENMADLGLVFISKTADYLYE